MRKKRERSIEFVAHTADLAVRVRAGSLGALFERSAEAVVELLECAGAGDAEEGGFVVEAETREDLLVRFLNEVLYRAQVGRRVPDGCRVTVAGEGPDLWRAECRAAFRRVAGTGREIKAATYHGLRIAGNRRGVCCTIIFDV